MVVCWFKFSIHTKPWIESWTLGGYTYMLKEKERQKRCPPSHGPTSRRHVTTTIIALVSIYPSPYCPLSLRCTLEVRGSTSSLTRHAVQRLWCGFWSTNVSILSSAVRECMVVAYIIWRPEVSQDRQCRVCINKIRPYGKEEWKVYHKCRGRMARSWSFEGLDGGGKGRNKWCQELLHRSALGTGGLGEVEIT